MRQLFFCFGAAALCLSGGCRPKSPKARTAPLLSVETVTARLDSLPDEMEFIGELESNSNVVIQPRVNGYLTSKRYADGMSVRRGDVLFTIDADLLQTTRLSAEAALQSARAKELEAKNNYERAVPLAAIEAISQTQLDQYKTQYAAARAAVSSAEQALRNAGLEVKYTRIVAPIDGVVAATKAHTGDYVGPGTQFEVLTTISDLDTLSVALSIPMSRYLEAGGGQKSLYDDRQLLTHIRLVLADGSEYPHAGSYYYTHKDVAASTGTLVISVNFPNPDRVLKAGQFARVKAQVGPLKGRVAVPQRCVSQAQGQNSVWVMRADSTVEYRKVELGDSYDGLWSILSGVQPGEEVLASGLQKVHNGEKVSPVKSR